MTRRRETVLAPPLTDLLARIGAGLEAGKIDQLDVAAAVEMLCRLPAACVVRAEAQIVNDARLWPRTASWTPPLLQSAKLLSETPGLEYVLLFHRDGYVREAALNKVNGPLPSPFAVAAIAWRLNDWVDEVRTAARACAERTFPLTAARTLADAQLALVARIARWGRWGPNVKIVQDAFARSDVKDTLRDVLLTTKATGAGTALRAALRSPGLDPYLPQLAQSARLAEVRGIALRALVTGGPAWRTGSDWKWENKPFGIKRWFAIVARREIAHGHSIEDIVRNGARDKSAGVRRAAADGLIHHIATLACVSEIVQILANDPSPSVRQRIEYIALVVGSAPPHVVPDRDVDPKP